MREKILVLGYFGYSKNELNGQTSKTRNVYEMLQSKSENLGEITYFDTQIFQFSKFSIFTMFKKVAQCDKLIYIPAHNNLQYLFPFIYFISRIRKSKILLIAVGGWLDIFIKSKKLHIILLAKIEGIFLQSERLRESLIAKYKFANVHYFPNFRINSFVPSYTKNEVFKIVFMARITRLKGMDYVFQLANYFSLHAKDESHVLIDFYGPINKEDENYFKDQIKKHKIISYKGILEPDKIYTTLNEYDLLVLPTRYPGEGFPGTILDAYISGIPVVVSDWKYNSEFVDQGKTGFLFDLNKEDEFHFYVDKLYYDPELLLQMKRNAFEKSKNYTPEYAWGIIENFLVG